MFSSFLKTICFVKKYENCVLVSPTFYDLEGNLEYNGGLLPENGEKNNVI